jgi:Uma2 family endonuclease
MATIEQSVQLAAEHRFVLYGIPWELYERLRESDENYRTRMTYDEGTLEFMAPSQSHEAIKSLLGRMVETLTEELKIPLKSLGSTTWKQQKKLKGLEPDECYYILNHHRIRGLKEIDLAVDPLPDLAIEVDIRPGEIDKTAIYSALGVSEIWRWRNGSLRAFVLATDQRYVESEMSLNLPMLRLRDLEPFLDSDLAEDESQWIVSFREWVRERFAQSR